MLIILYLNLFDDHVLGNVGDVVDVAGAAELVVRHNRWVLESMIQQ